MSAGVLGIAGEMRASDQWKRRQTERYESRAQDEKSAAAQPHIFHNSPDSLLRPTCIIRIWNRE